MAHLVGLVLGGASLAVLAAAATLSGRAARRESSRFLAARHQPSVRLAWARAEWTRFRLLELRRHLGFALRWLVLVALAPGTVWIFARASGSPVEGVAVFLTWTSAILWGALVAIRLLLERFSAFLLARGEVLVFPDGAVIGPVLVCWGAGAGVRLRGARLRDGLLELDLERLRGADQRSWEPEPLRLPVPPRSTAVAEALARALEAQAQSGSGQVAR